MNAWLADILSSNSRALLSVPVNLASKVRSAPSSPKLVFTHGDLAGRNLIIKDGKLVGLVDWEWSGWYAEHFERARVEVEEGFRSTTMSEEILCAVPEFRGEEKELYVTLARDVYLS